MSPTSAFAVLWRDGRAQNLLLDIDGDGEEAFEVAERIAINLAETGRTHVHLVISDLSALPDGMWEEARARLARARVQAEIIGAMKEAIT